MKSAFGNISVLWNLRYHHSLITWVNYAIEIAKNGLCLFMAWVLSSQNKLGACISSDTSKNAIVCIFRLILCMCIYSCFENLTSFGWVQGCLFNMVYRPTGIYTAVERINVHTLEWILYGLVWIGEFRLGLQSDIMYYVFLFRNDGRSKKFVFTLQGLLRILQVYQKMKNICQRELCAEFPV